MIHKLGFADTTVVIDPRSTTPDTLNLSIVLKLKPTILPEVSVTSAFIEEINPLRADFVLGHELNGEDLVELLSNNVIVVINPENKIKSRFKPIPGASDFVKDPYGNLHILTSKTAFIIYPDSLFTGTATKPVDFAKLNWSIQYCDEVTDTSFFIRRYKDNNQTMAFFAISSLHANRVSQLKEISNADRKNAVKAFADESNSLNNYVGSLGLSAVSASSLEEIDLLRKAERMVNMLEKNYVLPSYALLKLVNDSIYLFAHDIDSIFVYDQRWKLIKSKRCFLLSRFRLPPRSLVTTLQIHLPYFYIA